VVETKHRHCSIFVLSLGVLYSILHPLPLPKNHDLSDLTSVDKEYSNTISLISTLKALIYMLVFRPPLRSR
jgi:preprotein translocase subunit Sec63